MHRGNLTKTEVSCNVKIKETLQKRETTPKKQAGQHAYQKDTRPNAPTHTVLKKDWGSEDNWLFRWQIRQVKI